MKIKNQNDAVAFLLHNADHFINLISKVKIAFNYGRKDKQTCKYFNFLFTSNKGSRTYNKYALMQLGRLANSYSWEYLSKNVSKFYIDNCDKTPGLSHVDLEFIAYYQTGLVVAKIYQKIKLLFKNKQNGIMLPKCIYINIPSFISYIFSFDHHTISGRLSFDPNTLIQIFGNSRSIMYNLYYNHILDLIPTSNLRATNQDTIANNYAVSLSNKPNSGKFRLSGDLSDSNTKFDFKTMTFKLAKDGTLTFSFLVNDYNIFNSKGDNIYITLMTRDTSDSDTCDFREMDIGYLVDKKILTAPSNTAPTNFTNRVYSFKSGSQQYYSLTTGEKTPILYTLDLSNSYVQTALKLKDSGRKTNFNNCQFMLVGINTKRDDNNLKLGMVKTSEQDCCTLSLCTNTTPTETYIYDLEDKKYRSSNEVVKFDTVSGNWIYTTGQQTYTNDIEADYWEASSKKNPPLIIPLNSNKWTTDTTSTITITYTLTKFEITGVQIG